MIRPAPFEAELRRGEAASWGPRPDVGAARQSAHQAQILRWAPLTNPAGTMLGFLSVKLPSGMVINDLKLMIGPARKYWTALPSIKQTNKDGTPRLDERGKAVWRAIVDFEDRVARDRFNDLVLTALRSAHPTAFGEEGALAADRVDDLWPDGPSS
jgi:hypothetical protein